MAVPSFYNQADQKLYEDFQFVPQEKYRTGFTAPVQGGGEDASTPSFGIPNTNAFINSGGNQDLNTYVGQVGQYGNGRPITGGFSGAGFGIDALTGDIFGGGNIVDEFGTKGDVYAGTGITPGVNSVTGDLVSGGNIVDEFQEDGKNYSKSAFDETDDENKKGFIANMVSRAKQIGSDLPGWAKVAASTLIGGPFSLALGLGFNKGDGTGASYQQYTPNYNYRGLNNSLINDMYDSNPNSDTFGTNRFDRAAPGSFGSFRTLADYFGRDKDKSKDKDAAPGTGAEGPAGGATNNGNGNPTGGNPTGSPGSKGPGGSDAMGSFRRGGLVSIL